MSDCCESPVHHKRADLAVCKMCAQRGRSVKRITPVSLLLEGCSSRLGPSEYYYCPTPSCKAVYFSNEDWIYFEKGDLRVRIGQKETEDPVTICYCFEYTRATVWNEICTTGKSTVETTIKGKVNAGLCVCEIKNPQGSCCLGNLAKAVQEGFS